MASAITVLKSVRAATKVVNPNKVKIELKAESSLYPSFTNGGGVKKPCLRYAGSKQRYAYQGGERLKFAADRMFFRDAHVYRWTFETFRGKKQYLIVAYSQADARRVAKKIVERKLSNFKGLAKRALSVLMMKTSDMNVNDNGINQKTRTQAQKQTETREVVATSTDGSGAGKYMLYVCDKLKYALDAVKGGKSAVDVAMKRALNGITAQISKKIKTVDFLGRKMTLPTPFPEVKGKRK